MSDVCYCAKCKVAMGYRIDPLPDVWRESWRCYVCGSVYTKDHARYDLDRKKGPPVEAKAANKALDKPEGKPAGTDKVNAATGKGAESLDKAPESIQVTFEIDTDAPPPQEKRKRGRPRKT